jgi:hypothetical protein
MVLDPNIASDKGSDTLPVQPQASAIAMAPVTTMDLEETVASQSNDDTGMDLDLELNTARNMISNKGLVQPLASVTTTTTDTALDSEKGADMGLDANIADTAPIQPSASATAMASVTVMDLEQTVDSDDNDSRFSQGASSEECELTGDDDVTKDKKTKIRITFIISGEKNAFDN